MSIKKLLLLGVISLGVLACNGGGHDFGPKPVYDITPASIRVISSEFHSGVRKEASMKMTAEAKRVTACLNRVYGAQVNYLNIQYIKIVREPFLTPEGHIKRGECRSTDPVTCIQVWDGSLEYWSREVESVYRLRAFGYDKIYDRSVPTPELYQAGKACLK